MFLAKLIVHLFLILETSQMFGHFVLTTKTTQPPPQVFSVNGSIVWQFAALLTFFFSTYRKILPPLVDYSWF